MATRRKTIACTRNGDSPRPSSRDDGQRRTVYLAEDETDWWQQGEYLTLQEIRDLVERISAWSGIEVPRISNGDGKHVARGNKNSLVLPGFARNTSYVCHEMGHTIARQLGIDDYHGPVFTRILLDIVRQFIGPGQADQLCEKFVARGVEVSGQKWRRASLIA